MIDTIELAKVDYFAFFVNILKMLFLHYINQKCITTRANIFIQQQNTSIKKEISSFTS